jgi:hypothetical protein
MKVMDQTIAGAASGETAFLRRRRIHNLRQKDRRVTYGYGTLFCWLSEIGEIQSFFIFILKRGG